MLLLPLFFRVAAQLQTVPVLTFLIFPCAASFLFSNGGQVDTFIFAFEKAFDTPSHELLKCKLYGYGIDGKTLKWIDSYLFQTATSCSKWNKIRLGPPVLSGVPQSTVLGSVLFSLYINDIITDIDSEIRLFADDCVCYRKIKRTEDTVKLQEDIDRLGCWARKCNIMQITRKWIRKINAFYNLEGTVLDNVESRHIEDWCAQSCSMVVQFETPQVYFVKRNLRRCRKGQLDL